MRIKKQIKDAELIRKDDGYYLYKVVFEECLYYIYAVSRKFSKYQNVILEKDGTIVVEYMYLFGGRCGPAKVKRVLCKPIPDKAHFTFVAIRGTPNIVLGLDDGIYSSYSLPLENRLIYFLPFKKLLAHFKNDNKE